MRRLRWLSVVLIAGVFLLSGHAQEPSGFTIPLLSNPASPREGEYLSLEDLHWLQWAPADRLLEDLGEAALPIALACPEEGAPATCVCTRNDAIGIDDWCYAHGVAPPLYPQLVYCKWNRPWHDSSLPYSDADFRYHQCTELRAKQAGTANGGRNWQFQYRPAARFAYADTEQRTWTEELCITWRGKDATGLQNVDFPETKKCIHTAPPCTVPNTPASGQESLILVDCVWAASPKDVAESHVQHYFPDPAAYAVGLPGCSDGKICVHGYVLEETLFADSVGRTTAKVRCDECLIT